MKSNRVLSNRIEWKVTLKLQSPLHVGTNSDTGNELLHLENHNEKYFIIPGSSIRGVMKNYFYELSQIIGEEKLISKTEDMFGFTTTEKSKKGKLWVGDCYILKQSKTIKNITPIDRITHKPVAPLKVTCIKPNTTITFTCKLENPTSYEIGLFALFLKGLQYENITFGSGGSRGFGKVELVDTETNVFKYDRLNQQIITFDDQILELSNDDWDIKNDLISINYTLKNKEKSLLWMQSAVSSLKNQIMEGVKQ